MSQSDINQATADALNHQRKVPLDNQELRKTGFWLNQIFMIVSTIVGVYLAAQSGLQQALTFDTYSKMEDNYYLRMSLYDELQDNVRDVEKYATEVLAKSPALQIIKDSRPPMDLYVWETMRFHPSTLETPSEILTEVRRFYSQSRVLMDKVEKRSLGSAYGAEQLLKLSSHIQQQVLPALAGSATELKQALAEEGVNIGGLKELSHAH
ncbi:hypothetical protein GCM10009092_07220 [Bowmanella denitrificans]|uniref:Uncharacterized protein n=1 Tax=Bowmanella denitrificans TaxID=366582 RepID=A0ABN0WS41_9ALTE|nr:hypothetical protein [Bowmanella denitrificans]